MTLPEQEVEFIEAFVKADLRTRWRQMLDSPKKRLKQLDRLYHGFDFEAQTIEQHMHHATKQEEFVALLRSKGAGGPVYAISVDRQVDGNNYSFQDATDFADGVAWKAATVCIYSPARLAVFSDEYDRYVLSLGG